MGSNNLKHDLRTPLNHIIGYCEMLLEESADDAPPQLVADLQRIHLAGRRLLTVINDLFDPIKSTAYKANPALIHHEVRTPLNQIIGYAEMLQEEGSEQGAVAFAADAGKILEASRKLLILVVENFGESTSSLNIAENPVSTLPTTLLRHNEAVPASSARTATPVSGEQGGSILIVDDDEGNRTMLSRRLQRLGFRTTTAENGRIALERLKGAHFELMLLDIQMPELDGYQVLECLKADSERRDIPVIVLSASDEIERVARCIEMGAEDYLPKPFDPILLKARIGASLEKKRLRDREVSHLREIQEEKQRSDDLLHIILPHDVAQELKLTQAVKPRRFDNVGVLFCDIVSFTAWCDKHAPHEVLTYLQSLVEAFERISLECGLEKIKTIGDSFMATAGLLAPATNPALDCVRCGLAMIAKAKELPPHWQVRVGIHAGPVMAGVVGRRKYQYDIWGDTVNTAARMEQAALPESICVTAETWQLLSSHCRGVRQGNAEIKGKGTLELYRINGINAEIKKPLKEQQGRKGRKV
jgi:class 3 adenylate cyclase